MYCLCRSLCLSVSLCLVSLSSSVCVSLCPLSLPLSLSFYEGTSGTKFLFAIPGTVYERLQFFFCDLVPLDLMFISTMSRTLDLIACRSPVTYICPQAQLFVTQVSSKFEMLISEAGG